MKTIVALPIFILVLSFSQCDKDQLDSNPPIQFDKAYYQDWVGGQPGSKGTLITLIANTPERNIKFDSIYFNKNVAKLSAQYQGNSMTLTANLIQISPKDRDLILSGNSKEEFGNKPPKKLPIIPFEIADNEAIISYFIKNKKRYFKLQNLEKEKSIMYQ